jgi:Dyp-type peroxidase family
MACADLKYLVLHSNHVNISYSRDIKISNLERLEKSLTEEKRKQPGVAFPSATTQEHLLIVRLNISHPVSKHEDREHVRNGVMRLCKFIARIDAKKIKMDNLAEDGDIEPVPLSDFNFSATLGFGMGFFEKLKIDSRNRPKKLREMPNHTGLGDPRPYTLLQTDLIIQLGSDIEDVNRWVFQHTTARTEKTERAKGRRRFSYLNHGTYDGAEDGDVDVCSAISDWAAVTDIHAGFQRNDGRNLLGFNDGISNPKRLSNDVVWITHEDENQKLTDGTYMVFQKIEHDLDRWRNLTVEKQEEWVGRSKGTGLLLGTLPKDLDRKLAADLHSENPNVRNQAKKQWKKLYDEQKDPDRKFFDPNRGQYRNIQLQCPVWSHVRKSNPRQADGAARSLIFRRGYLFLEGGSNGIFDSGLLFICFQRDIDKGFEYIKRNFLNNKNFPVPDQRKNFNTMELARRHQYGRFTDTELKKGVVGPHSTHYDFLVKASHDPDAQNTGKEGLSGPSELGVHPEGQFPITVTLGGGYYFIPPIPNKKISEISEQFFA